MENNFKITERAKAVSGLPWFVRDAVRKYKTGCLQQQKCVISQVWRLEVCEQGANRRSSFRNLSPWLACACLLFLSSPGPSFVSCPNLVYCYARQSY